MTHQEIEAVRAILTSRPRPTDLAERRERVDSLGAGYEYPADAAIEAVSIGDIAAEWTLTPNADPSRVLLFLHGGGYISGSIKSHRHVVIQVGREARVRTLALGYRLAPEHPFPAALDDTIAAYKHLLASDIAPGDIVMAGESAGGGLAIAALVSLRDAGLPLPRCTWLASPWVDLRNSGASMRTKDAVDPLIHKPYLDELAALYLRGTDPAQPLASPIHADLRGLPPMLVQVGSAETLLDDAISLAGVAGSADVAVTLEVWPHMIHAWHLFYPQLAEGRASLASVGDFVRRHMAA